MKKLKLSIKRRSATVHSNKENTQNGASDKPQTQQEFVAKSTLGKLYKVWEENAHVGGQKLSGIEIPYHLFENDSELWDSPELMELCKQFFLDHNKHLSQQ